LQIFKILKPKAEISIYVSHHCTYVVIANRTHKRLKVLYIGQLGRGRKADVPWRSSRSTDTDISSVCTVCLHHAFTSSAAGLPQVFKKQFHNCQAHLPDFSITFCILAKHSNKSTKC